MRLGTVPALLFLAGLAAAADVEHTTCDTKVSHILGATCTILVVQTLCLIGLIKILMS